MTPTITDDDKGTITATVDGKVVRSWSYDGFSVIYDLSVIDDRRVVMRQAREYAEGWHNACSHQMEPSQRTNNT